jgi:hypothetical protein
VPQETIPLSVLDEGSDDVAGVVDAEPPGAARCQRVVERRVDAVVEEKPMADVVGTDVGSDDGAGVVDLGRNRLVRIPGTLSVVYLPSYRKKPCTLPPAPKSSPTTSPALLMLRACVTPVEPGALSVVKTPRRSTKPCSTGLLPRP